MKKFIVCAAALMMAAFSFADGFKNKINVGGVYSNVGVKADTNGAKDLSVVGVGLNFGWRGTFDNGLTLLADLDVLPGAKLKGDGDDMTGFTAAAFSIGVGREWEYSKGTFAVAGILGDEIASKEKSGTDSGIEITSYFIGMNLYGTYKFTDLVGLYLGCSTGVGIGGDLEAKTYFGNFKNDLKAGQFFFVPKFGVVFEF